MRFTLKLFFVLIAVTFLGGMPKAEAANYLEEQAIDQELGLLDQPWKINRVRMYTPESLPPQMKLGLPPYDQQVENAQVRESATGTGGGPRA